MSLLIVTIVIFQVVSPLALSIAGIVIGSQNMMTTCDHMPGYFMSLSTWLIVFGSVTLGFVVMAVLALALLISGHPSFFILYLISSILGGLFMLAWNIIGAVALFRDSPSCQSLSYSLWAMTLAVLIFQWVGMLITCCSSVKSKDQE